MNVIINRVLDHRQKNQHKKNPDIAGFSVLKSIVFYLNASLKELNPILRTGILRVIHYTTRSKYVNQITVLSEVK